MVRVKNLVLQYSRYSGSYIHLDIYQPYFDMTRIATCSYKKSLLHKPRPETRPLVILYTAKPYFLTFWVWFGRLHIK